MQIKKQETRISRKFAKHILRISPKCLLVNFCISPKCSPKKYSVIIFYDIYYFSKILFRCKILADNGYTRNFGMTDCRPFPTQVYLGKPPVSFASCPLGNVFVFPFVYVKILIRNEASCVVLWKRIVSFQEFAMS